MSNHWVNSASPNMRRSIYEEEVQICHMNGTQLRHDGIWFKIGKMGPEFYYSYDHGVKLLKHLGYNQFYYSELDYLGCCSHTLVKI